jgi:diadenosine tetraphosphatase ApaH/serine/threonine PP2A family protein phosphatase
VKAGQGAPVSAQTHWVAEQLRPDQLELLASWPATLTLDVEGVGEVLFCHASPRSDTEIFTRLTPKVQIRPMLQEAAEVIVCGHTHMQFERKVGGKQVFNAGSVGMPYGKPRAYWLLLGPGVEFRRTAYDFESAAERICATAYPGAEVLARDNIVRPPTEQEALDFFTSSR